VRLEWLTDVRVIGEHGNGQKIIVSPLDEMDALFYHPVVREENQENFIRYWFRICWK
jgi:hypothetical protein